MLDANNNHVIYKLTSPDGKAYIGKTKRYDRRISHHCTKRNKCRALADAIQLYGFDNFTKEILADNLTPDAANRLEAQYINRQGTLYPDGYNMQTGGDVGFSVCDETLAKVAEGRRNIPKEVYARAAKTRTGMKRTDEARANMSVAQRNRPTISDETRRRLSESHKGKKFSEETRLKMSEATQLQWLKRRNKNAGLSV